VIGGRSMETESAGNFNLIQNIEYKVARFYTGSSISLTIQNLGPGKIRITTNYGPGLYNYSPKDLEPGMSYKVAAHNQFNNHTGTITVAAFEKDAHGLLW
jgi:hypothetical protein